MIASDYVNIVLKKEGEQYTDDPKDSGGCTKWGITETTGRAYGYTGDMRLMPRQTAFEIYMERYWIAPRFDVVNQVAPTLAERLLDFGVLAGQSTAAKQLQRVLNVLNRNGRDYQDLVPDGRIGNLTLDALEAVIKKRGTEGLTVVLGMTVSLQSAYLIELAERRPKDEEYQYGWQLNRAIGAVLVNKA